MELLYILALLASYWLRVATSFSSGVNATILLMYSSVGEQQWGLSADIVGARWQQHLSQKCESDSSWPFRGTVEFMDIKSNETLIFELLTARLSNQTLPPVTVVLGPESVLGLVAAPLVAPYNIANILATTNPDPISITPPIGTETTFYIEAPAQYTYRTMIDLYLEVGIRSMAVVAVVGETDPYNYNTCIYTGRTLATPFGITVVEFTYEFDVTNDELVAIVEQIRDFNPDAVFWCDWEAQTYQKDSNRFPLPLFKQVNYLPKALTILDIYDSSNVTIAAHPQAGYLDFVGAGTFVHNSLKGQEYTQEERPYSALFRPSAPETSMLDALVCGSAASSPSSVKLFNDWFLNETGAYPIYQTNGLWAAFDIIEAALYRAAHIDAFIEDGLLLGDEVIQFFYDAQTVGPYGRVIFDERRMSTPTPALFLQLIPTNRSLPAIVSPSSQAYHGFVYPMPTWTERLYVWSLVKSPYIATTVAVGGVFSLLLLTMAVTITIHKKDVAVRMLDYRHMSLVCVLSCVIIWALVFLWQDDAVQIQCTSFLWPLVIPASFIINLINMKAYRLSLFIRLDTNASAKRTVNHRFVLVRALGFTGVTSVMLLGTFLGDPPSLTLTVVDPYRPSLNYHTCQSRSGATPGILWIIVILHFIMSGVCVNRVRNGFEAFRDGMLMKEAYLLLYGSMLITFMMQTLKLTVSDKYLLRTIFLGFGITGFCARLLLSRCTKHWIPGIVRLHTGKAINRLRYHWYELFGSPITVLQQPPHHHPEGGGGAAALSVSHGVVGGGIVMGDSNPLGHHHSSNNNSVSDHNQLTSPRAAVVTDTAAATRSNKVTPSGNKVTPSSKEVSPADEDPIYQQEAPTDDSIAVMMGVFTDTQRYKIFREVAEKALVVENVDFLQAVLNYQSKAEEILLQSSIDANAEIRQLAMNIHGQYVKPGADAEVNLSSSTRGRADRKLRAWREDLSMLTHEQREAALNSDCYQRKQVFDQSMKEISVLLYQNLWNSFRAAETTAQMARSSKTHVHPGHASGAAATPTGGGGGGFKRRDDLNDRHSKNSLVQ